MIKRFLIMIKKLILIIIVFSAGGYVLNQKKEPRGLRNNNAGNIENNGIQWEGLSSIQTDTRFYQFESPEYGIRAIAKILKTYQTKYGINTISGIINRWAPPLENDTGSYVAHVAHVLGVLPNETINVNDYMVLLIKSIIVHENGYNPYKEQTIVNGVMLA